MSETTKLPNGGVLYTLISGDKYYYLNDHLHREDGPAIENINGDKHWYLNGQSHREDGPACEFVNGHKSWWLNGEPIPCNTQDQFERLLKLKAFW
jgi:hypothetical protein